MQRDYYIDFLRALGLLLLVVAHTWAPEWLANIRTFDVPLMVFISSICYKPLGGYLAYCKRRFKRIYIPVFVFLSIFFISEVIAYFFFGKPRILPYTTILGSFMLLNSPSIGYVWIMRIFLMMAFLVPVWEMILRQCGFKPTIIIVVVLLFLQQILVTGVNSVDNKIIRFILDETLLYANGYSVIAIIGLKVRQFSQRELTVLIGLLLVLTLLFVGYKHWIFDPQAYKYPPRSLYILYGLLVSCILWAARSVIHSFPKIRFVTYLSENSMWIYLWHIIPVYMISPWATVPNMWFGRYCVVLVVALSLNYTYQQVIRKFPHKIYKAIR